MGRLLKSLFICGSTSYTKFENNDTKSDYLCYKCENCGHQGTVKVRLFNLIRDLVNMGSQEPVDFENCVLLYLSMFRMKWDFSSTKLEN